ncbi:cation-translocating P-type ATPase [Faecalicatena contorta]|nr:cation-translocating P-type ATPase [Faecalicatena contorta]
MYTSITSIRSVSGKYSEQEIYRLTAAVEKNSEHPLGKAIVSCFQEEETKTLEAVSDFEMIPGRGVKGVVNQQIVIAGNDKLLLDEGIELPEEIVSLINQELKRGGTAILVAVCGMLAGYIVLEDTLRPESKEMIRQLKNLEIMPVLLTGDHESAAGRIASELGISDVYSGCLPEDKLRQISSYQEQKESVCMVGDGVNDAPALKKANVGIAMGGVESDIAVDAADIALVDDEVKELPHLLALSGKMMRKIRFNLSFSMILNFVAIVLAMTGILNPIVGALVHNCGSVFVIINSALLLRYK